MTQQARTPSWIVLSYLSCESLSLNSVGGQGGLNLFDSIFPQMSESGSRPARTSSPQVTTWSALPARRPATRAAPLPCNRYTLRSPCGSSITRSRLLPSCCPRPLRPCTAVSATRRRWPPLACVGPTRRAGRHSRMNSTCLAPSCSLDARASISSSTKDSTRVSKMFTREHRLAFAPMVTDSLE